MILLMQLVIWNQFSWQVSQKEQSQEQELKIQGLQDLFYGLEFFYFDIAYDVMMTGHIGTNAWVICENSKILFLYFSYNFLYFRIS